ncbi:MAG: transcriptional activator [Chloroflexota bacterium]|nr:MAG: transcriptional activator [Chloroflexota bacterium]
MTRILHIHLLGDFRLIYGDTPLTTVNTSRLQSLLAYLVLQRHAPQSRHHLAFLLWPDTPEAQAHTNLRTLLHRLRLALPEADRFLQADAQTVRWRSDAPFTLDVADFEQSFMQTASATVLQQAINLYQGDLLPGCYDDWILPHRERLRQAFSQALEKLIIRLENERDYPAAIRSTQRLLRHDSLHEATYRRLMRLYALNGDRAGVQQVYQDCLATLQRELDVAPSPATRQAYERLAYIDTPITTRHNLPVQLIPFIGREEELAQLANLLANPACRLLTLVGPGGIGKTRLAIRAARAQIGVYLHGIYLASLAATISADFLVSALADALNFAFHGPEDPKIQLLNYLREKEILLVLDNFEHLLAPTEDGKSGGAGLLVEILTGAPEVKLLVTSRERLNLPGEWLFEIEGLSTPPPVSPLTGLDTATKLETYSAVALFLQTGQRVQAGFLLEEEIQAAVAHLCRLVEGMPLALELAGGWVRSLSCAEIVRELEQNLSFLATSQRHVIERHQSMQAVFDHSWRLLSAEERHVFRQLSVFQGGFRREAAEQVASASLPLLSALVDKSLLRRQPSGRYDLHELLRQYAAARLAEEPEEQEAVQERHSNYYMEFLHLRSETLQSSHQRQAMAEIRVEMDNLRSAWLWGVAQGQVQKIGRSLSSLWRFYDGYGLFQEAEATFGQAVAELTGAIEISQIDKPHRAGDEEKQSQIVLGQLLGQQGWFAFRCSWYEKSRKLLQRSVALLRQWGARAELADSLYYLGTLDWQMGNYAETESLLRESLVIYRELRLRTGIGLSLGILGLTAQAQGQYVTAKDLMQQSFGPFKETDDQLMIAAALGFIAPVLLALGERTQAKQRLQESLDLLRSLGYSWGLALCFNHLGLLADLTQETERVEAQRLHQESLTIFTELGDRRSMALSLNYLGQVAATAGHIAYPEARQHYLAALQMAIEVQVVPIALAALTGLAALLVAPPIEETKADLIETKARAAEYLSLVLHHPASQHETKERAGRLLAELESQLPPQVSAAARARGQTRPLEAVAAEILAGM